MPPTIRKLCPEHPQQVLKRLIPEIKSRGAKPELPCVIEELNDLLHGFHRGFINMVTARTSHGKSAFMGQHAIEFSRLGKNVLFFSLEDGRARLVERFLCQELSLKAYDLRRGILPNEMTEGSLINDFLMVEDDFGFNLKELEYAYENTVFPNGERADVVFWDYVQKIDGASLGS
jgi:replicative DNA helicase